MRFFDVQVSHCPTCPTPWDRWDSVGHSSQWDSLRLWDRDSFSHLSRVGK